MLNTKRLLALLLCLLMIRGGLPAEAFTQEPDTLTEAAPLSTERPETEITVTPNGSIKDENGNALSGISVLLWNASANFRLPTVNSDDKGEYGFKAITGHSIEIRPCDALLSFTPVPYEMGAVYTDVTVPAFEPNGGGQRRRSTAP